MNSKPKLFIGSASESLEFANALEYELRNDALTEVWDYDTFHPGHYTLESLTRKATEVNFAAFILGQDDKTESRGEIMASPRDNVVYESGLFAGHIGIHNVFLIVDSRGAKIPSDWQGLSILNYNPDSESQKEIIHNAAIQIRKQLTAWTTAKKSSFEQNIIGYWWQYVINIDEGSVVSLLTINGYQENSQWKITGEAWSLEGKSIATFWSRAVALDVKERKLFYYWEGKYPFDKFIPEFFGVGEIQFDFPGSGSISKADGWLSSSPLIHLDDTVRKSTKYIRASEEDIKIMDGKDHEAIGKLIGTRLEERQQMSS